jgi:hypothetical protein
MTDLRQLARGKQCHLRFVGTCLRSTETVVLAHARKGAAGGMGLKPPDICGIPACHACHQAWDGQVKSMHSRAQMDADALRGLCQWLDYLYKSGFITTSQGDQ